MLYNKNLRDSITLLTKLSFLLTKTELSLYKKLEEVLEILSVALKVKRCSLILYNKETRKYEMYAAKGMNIPFDELKKIDPVNDSQIIKYVIENKEPIVVCKEEDMLKLGITPKKNYKIQSFISVPLISNGNFLGVMNLTETESEKPFSKVEAHTIVILSDHIATTIENAQLSEEVFRNRLIKEQLKIAKRVQFSFVPDEFPNNNSIEAFGFTEPTFEVGGDYLDILQINNDEYAFIVGDVSGKGIPAALIMTSFRSYWRALVKSTKSPKKIFEKLNSVLLDDLEKESLYLTCFYGIYNCKTRTLQFGNAGHEFPMYFSKKNNTIKLIEKNNTILGAFENMKFSTFSKKVEKGDIIIIYSDGITDFKFLRNIDAEKIIEDIFLKFNEKPLKFIVKKVKDTLREYLNGLRHSDDLTFLAVRFK
jgi:sigma-B regulation protein RsbU (phosphoserine phosphatase)